MHPQGSAERSNPHESRNRTGHVISEHAELVDHHDQARQGAEPCTPGKLGHVLHAVLCQDCFPPAQLGAEGDEGPGDGLCRKVGEEPDGVRQPCELAESRAALEINQQEVDPHR